MSREKLREAIELVEMTYSGFWVTDNERAALEKSIAAARAYACERCEDGFVLKEESELEAGFTTCWKPCPDCADYRKIADGGE